MKAELMLSNKSILLDNEKVIKSSLDAFKKYPDTVNRPISFLSNKLGLTLENLYDKFIPLISTTKKIDELIAYADLGVEILHFTDRNMWRTKLPEQFFFMVDTVVDVVKEVIEDEEMSGWLKRKAIKMYMKLTDEQADKKRFIEYVLTEEKVNEIAESFEKQKVLEAEIVSEEK